MTYRLVSLFLLQALYDLRERLYRDQSRCRRHCVRCTFCYAVLPLITMSGCATTPPVFRTSTFSPTIIRAESNQLGDLEHAAHDGSNESSGSQARADSKCSRCKKNPCTCGSSPNNASSSDSASGKLFLLVISSPFTLPAMILNDDYDHYSAFPDFPYADDVPGSLLKSSESTIDSEEKPKKQPYSANLQLFGVPGVDNVDRLGGRLQLDSDLRVGIDTESNYWLGSRAGGGTDHLWTGDANLVFRFAESEHIQFRTGVGVNWLADQTRPEAGFNFTYGFGWFPVRPWTVSSVIDCGTLGHGSLFHNRSTAGLMLGPCELFAGYDYFQLSSFHSQGPVAGVGWRF